MTMDYVWIPFGIAFARSIDSSAICIKIYKGFPPRYTIKFFAIYQVMTVFLIVLCLRFGLLLTHKIKILFTQGDMSRHYLQALTQ